MKRCCWSASRPPRSFAFDGGPEQGRPVELAHRFRTSFAADLPNNAEEEWGIEDPRDLDRGPRLLGHRLHGLLAPRPFGFLGRDDGLPRVQSLGAVMPPENKDAAVFPRRFGNHYAMIHRPVASGQSGANMWISFSPDLTYWGKHEVLLQARRGAWWDAGKIG